MIKFSIPIFFTFSYTIGLSQISWQISVYYECQNSCFLDLYFREFTAAINFPCFKSWLRIGEMKSISQNATRVEITMTISSAIRTQNNKNFGSDIRAIFHINRYYSFKPCSIFEEMTSFSQILSQDLEQGKLMAALNSPK